MSRADLGSSGLSPEEIMSAVPPTAKIREFRIGVFVVLGVLGFLTFLFMMTDPGTFRGRYTIHTRLSDAGGVRNGDAVQLRGINIGRVTGSELAGPDVVLALEIDNEWRLPRGSSAVLASAGVLGGIVVSIEPGSGEDFVEPLEEIPGASYPGMMESAGELAVEAGEAMNQIRNLFADSTLEAASGSISRLRDLISDISRLIDSQGGELRELTGTLLRSAENVEGITSAEEWSEVLASAETTIAALDGVSAELGESVALLNEVLARIERGEGTLGLLSTDDRLYESLVATTESIRELVVDLKANPGRYVKVEIF
ncbi:MAG: MlaD family protein [Gemmatimonadetes bacterium]|nr:MlaD family protein [Gemmatimonadota bacterium]MCY3943018.1 MlaD family protein [Gemmatimonadota bacterium]